MGMIIAVKTFESNQANYNYINYSMASSSRIKPFEIDGDSARLPSEWETWTYDLEAFFLAPPSALSWPTWAVRVCKDYYVTCRG